MSLKEWKSLKCLLRRKGLGSSDDQCYSGAMGSTDGTSLGVSELTLVVELALDSSCPLCLPLRSSATLVLLQSTFLAKPPCHAHLDTQQNDLGMDLVASE